MYSSRITRLNPSAFVILIDQSGSMDEKISFGRSFVPKASAVASVTNDLISELIVRCRREDGVAGYFDLAVFGYGGDGVVPMFGGRGGFMDISRLAALDVPVRESTVERVLPDGRRLFTALSEKMWVAPSASGGTPMYAALDVARRLVSKWCSRPEHRGAYPPTVFNITDGESSDADDGKLLGAASAIRDLCTSDGNVLLINIHIASSADCSPAMFPAGVHELPPQRYARLLYDMSSEMPGCYDGDIRAVAASDVAGPRRGMSFNCGISELVSMLTIGSVTVNNIR